MEYAKVAAFLKAERTDSGLGAFLRRCIHKIIQISALPFGRTPDLALPFSGIETFGKSVVQFLIFRRGQVRIAGNSLLIGYPVVLQLVHPDNPFSGWSADFVLISDLDLARRLYTQTLELNLALIAGFGGLASGFKNPDGPEVFVQAQALRLYRSHGTYRIHSTARSLAGRFLTGQFRKKLVKIGDSFNSLVKIEQIEFLIR